MLPSNPAVKKEKKILWLKTADFVPLAYHFHISKISGKQDVDLEHDTEQRVSNNLPFSLFYNTLHKTQTIVLNLSTSEFLAIVSSYKFSVTCIFVLFEVGS